MPKNTLSTWEKNELKILSSFEQSKVTATWKHLQTRAYGDVDQAIFMRFNSERSQQIPIPIPMLKVKAIDFARGLMKSDFKSSNRRLTTWKEM